MFISELQSKTPITLLLRDKYVSIFDIFFSICYVCTCINILLLQNSNHFVYFMIVL